MSIAGVLLAVLTVPQAVAEDSPSTSVIIDASGSMLAPDAGGQTRMDAAKQATEGLLNDLPKEQRLSLLTYGTQTGSGDEEKAAGCQDVTTLVPMGGNRAEMVSKVKGKPAWLHPDWKIPTTGGKGTPTAGRTTDCAGV